MTAVVSSSDTQGPGSAGVAKPPVAPPPPDLPSGRHRLSPEFVRSHQRARLLRAVCEVCASRGYESATIAQIVRAASVSTRTFYTHYPSKQECFLDAYRTTLSELHERLAAATSSATGGREALALGLRALLHELSTEPILARTLFVDILFAGPQALRMRQEALLRYQQMLPHPPSAPPGVTQAVIGGMVETIYHTILEDRASALEGMYDELLYCLFIPLLGHEETLALCARVGADPISRTP